MGALTPSVAPAGAETLSRVSMVRTVRLAWEFPGRLLLRRRMDAATRTLPYAPAAESPLQPTPAALRYSAV